MFKNIFCNKNFIKFNFVKKYKINTKIPKVNFKPNKISLKDIDTQHDKSEDLMIRASMLI